MAHGIFESLWLKMLLGEVGFLVVESMSLYCNNKAAISIVHDLVQHDRTKHVEVDRHFIKNYLKKGAHMYPLYPNLTSTCADVFTKGLSEAQFMYLTSKL